MSISLDSWDKLMDNYEIINKKVESILGYEAINSNHYGQTLLYNIHIDIRTDEQTIRDIDNKFRSLCSEIIEMFSQYELTYKDDYFYVDQMSGLLSFLSIPIDINQGIKKLQPAIHQFAKVYHRVNLLTSNFNNIRENYFYLSYIDNSGVLHFGFLNSIININTSENEIDQIISDYYVLNNKVNRILKLCDYHSSNQIYPRTNKEYYLFSIKVDRNTTESQLINITHSAKLLESNIKLVFDELNICEDYEIVYNYEIGIKFDYVTTKITLDMNYEDLKKDIMEMD